MSPLLYDMAGKTNGAIKKKACGFADSCARMGLRGIRIHRVLLPGVQQAGILL